MKFKESMNAKEIWRDWQRDKKLKEIYDTKKRLEKKKEEQNSIKQGDDYKMANELNVKQEKFIQGIINGLSQRQAYKEAYQVNYADEAIDVKACELFNTDKVQVRYKELLKEIQDKAIMTAQERMIWLTDVIKKESTANMTDKLKAVDVLNKMSGEYTTKIDANVNTDIKVTLEDD